jgi:hypothetical protein
MMNSWHNLFSQVVVVDARVLNQIFFRYMASIPPYPIDPSSCNGETVFRIKPCVKSAVPNSAGSSYCKGTGEQTGDVYGDP